MSVNPPISYFANAVYYPNWAVYSGKPPSYLNLPFISHIFYAFAWPGSDGTISFSDENADADIEVDGVQGCINALGALRQHNRQLKIILSVGGYGQGSTYFATIARDEVLRHMFARNVRDFVDMYDFDGIDIDWEHPADPRQGADYVLLLQAIRGRLPHPYHLSSALPAGAWALNNIDVRQASLYLDTINLMAYDFSGPWTSVSGHQSQLFTPQNPHNHAATTSCHSAVSYLCSRGVSPGKILLGIPTYGRSFLGVDAIGQVPSRTAGESEVFEYCQLPRPGAREYVDAEHGAAYCIGGDDGFVTYDSPQTVQMKAHYVKSYRLGGLFYWTGTGDARGPRSLVETGYNTLHNL